MASHSAAPDLTVLPEPEAVGARLAELFEEHGRMVYGLCRLLLRDGVEAEDAAQESFLSAQQSLLTGHEPRDARAWLAAIARNECRARIRERMRAPLALVGEVTSGEGDVERVAGERDEMRALCGAVAGLPPQQRDAVILREFYGLSYEEAATALGVSHSAFETLLHRGRNRLQQHLRPIRIEHGALALPAVLREGLAASVPGFAAAGATGAGGGGIVAAAIAKLVSLPAAAKVVAATIAASVAATGAVATPPGRDVVRSAERALTRAVAFRTAPALSSSPAQAAQAAPAAPPVRLVSAVPEDTDVFEEGGSLAEVEDGDAHEEEYEGEESVSDEEVWASEEEPSWEEEPAYTEEPWVDPAYEEPWYEPAAEELPPEPDPLAGDAYVDPAAADPAAADPTLAPDPGAAP